MNITKLIPAAGRILTALFLVALFNDLVLADSALLSEQTYKRLSAIHELMGEEKYDEALKRLDALAPTVSKRKYENAVVQQTYGYVYVAKDQPRKAIAAFKECLVAGAMPETAQQNVRLNLAQAYMSVEEYGNALSTYEDWVGREKTPSPAAYALGGTLYAQAKKYTLAAQYLDNAIRASKEPREDWYRMLLAIYYDDKKYKQAAPLLEKMVARFPTRKEYWLQLSAVHNTLGNDRSALAALQLAHEHGLLTEERELLNLARFYIYLGIPFKAMQVIEQGMQANTIESSEPNLELLYQACFRANELDKAIAALSRLSAVSGDGKYLVRMAHLQMEMGQWKPANENITAALERGGLEQDGAARLLQGISYYELNEYQKATDAFQRAQQHAASADEAEQWLKFLENRQAMNQ